MSAVITAEDKEYDGTTDAVYTCEVSGARVRRRRQLRRRRIRPPSTTRMSGTDKTVTAENLRAERRPTPATTPSPAPRDTDEANITKATLLVDADDATKDYGDDDPAFTYTLSGFVDGEDELTADGLDGSPNCTRDAGESVIGSPYEITCTPGTLVADNYDFETGEHRRPDHREGRPELHGRRIHRHLRRRPARRGGHLRGRQR